MAKAKVIELKPRHHCDNWGYAEQLDKMAKALRALSKEHPKDRLIARTARQFALQSERCFQLACDEIEAGRKVSLGRVYPGNR